MNTTNSMLSRRQVLQGLTSGLVLSTSLGACASKNSSAGSALAAETSTEQKSLATHGSRGEQAVCTPTTSDLRGPYWTRNDPSVADLVTEGPLLIEGIVRGDDCNIIPTARINVWQADAAGGYDDEKLRGILGAAKDGTYAFRSIRPGNYREPGGWRPAHIHFDVSAPGYQSFVGQLYFAGDRFLGANDSCGVCKSSDADRIIELKDVPGRRGHQRGEFVITMARV